MAAPTNTYNSNTELSLGQVPQVDDPDLYEALLDIHNAIEAIITASDDGDAIFQAYIDKQRNVITVIGDYTVTTLDGTVRVDASAGDITVTLFAVSGFLGYKQYIKRVDEVFANKVTLVGDGTELVDDRASGINISTKSSYSVKSNLTGWDIV